MGGLDGLRTVRPVGGWVGWVGGVLYVLCVLVPTLHSLEEGTGFCRAVDDTNADHLFLGGWVGGWAGKLEWRKEAVFCFFLLEARGGWVGGWVGAWMDGRTVPSPLPSLGGMVTVAFLTPWRPRMSLKRREGRGWLEASS